MSRSLHPAPHPHAVHSAASAVVPALRPAWYAICIFLGGCYYPHPGWTPGTNLAPILVQPEATDVTRDFNQNTINLLVKVVDDPDDRVSFEWFSPSQGILDDVEWSDASETERNSLVELDRATFLANNPNGADETITCTVRDAEGLHANRVEVTYTLRFP